MNSVTKTTQAEFARHAVEHGLSLIQAIWKVPLEDIVARLDSEGMANLLMKQHSTLRRPVRKRSFGIERETDKGSWSRLELSGSTIYLHASGLWLVHNRNDDGVGEPNPCTVVYA